MRKFLELLGACMEPQAVDASLMPLDRPFCGCREGNLVIFPKIPAVSVGEVIRR